MMIQAVFFNHFIVFYYAFYLTRNLKESST